MSGAVLIRAVLRRVSMRGVKLQMALLGGANLFEADLTDADLSGADLSYAILLGACLRRANCGPLQILDQDGQRTGRLAVTNLTGADLRKTDLSYANFGRAITSGTLFAGATMKDSIMPDQTPPPGSAS